MINSSMLSLSSFISETVVVFMILPDKLASY